MSMIDIDSYDLDGKSVDELIAMRAKELDYDLLKQYPFVTINNVVKINNKILEITHWSSMRKEENS